MPLTPADDSEFDWIKDAGGPPACERTICVLHIMAEDLSIADHSLTWARWAEDSGEKDRELDRIRSQSPSCEGIARALAKGEPVGGVPVEGAPLRRILWREIAERHGLDVQEMVDLWAIWRSLDRKLGGVPRYLVGTDREGRIDDLSAHGVAEAIRRVVGTESCRVHFFAGVDERWGNDTPFVLSCSLDDVEHIVTDRTVGGRAGPDYWWAPDHSWYVYTDYDSTLTWVGGSQELIDAIENEPEVESFVGVPRRHTAADN